MKLRGTFNYKDSSLITSFLMQEKRKLKKDLEEAQRAAEDMEMKFHDTAGQLDMIRADLEEALRKNQALEKKLQASLLNQVNINAQPAAEVQRHLQGNNITLVKENMTIS
jgi:hypothetical protein